MTIAKSDLESEIAYNDVVELGEWLEDDGDCSRYMTGDEASEWVCHACGSVIDDPTEHGCNIDDEE